MSQGCRGSHRVVMPQPAGLVSSTRSEQPHGGRAVDHTLQAELCHERWELGVGGLVVVWATDVAPVRARTVRGDPCAFLDQPRDERRNVAGLPALQGVTCFG